MDENELYDGLLSGADIDGLPSAIAKRLSDPAGVNVDVGEYCYYNGVLYIANAAITSSMAASSFISRLTAVSGGVGAVLTNKVTTMKALLPQNKSIDVVIRGNNYNPPFAIIITTAGNSGTICTAWLVIGFGTRASYHFITTLYASASAAISVTSGDGKITITNSNQTYIPYVSVAILMDDTGTELSLSDPY